MKTFLKQFLLIGGFYFVISLILNFFQAKIADILDNIISFAALAIIVILCFKKSYDFLIIFQDKNPKTSLYLMGIGGVNFIGILLFGIFGAIDGYKSTLAQYNGIDYESLYSQYIGYALVFYAILFVLVLLWVTYINFIKPHTQKQEK